MYCNFKIQSVVATSEANLPHGRKCKSEALCVALYSPFACIWVTGKNHKLGQIALTNPSIAISSQLLACIISASHAEGFSPILCNYDALVLFDSSQRLWGTNHGDCNHPSLHQFPPPKISRVSYCYYSFLRKVEDPTARFYAT